MLPLPVSVSRNMVPGGYTGGLHVCAVVGLRECMLIGVCTRTIEWSSFVVLNLGLDVITSLPPGVCAVAGLFQSFAVRASGFAIVNLSALASSFQCADSFLPWNKHICLRLLQIPLHCDDVHCGISGNVVPVLMRGDV